MSIAKATSLGKVVKFDESTCKILNKAEEVIGVATKHASLYYLSRQVNTPQQTINVNTVKNRSRIMVWHYRYGHLNVTSLRKLANERKRFES